MFALREPINALTHGIGILLSAVGTIWLIYEAVRLHSGFHLAGAIVFGVSLLCLYTASTLYHGLPVGPKAIALLRRIDHTMIYVLIAGTYTPVCLVTLRGPKGWILFGIVWGLAVLGIILKLVWMRAPRWLYTGFYLLLGWLAAFFIVPLFKALPLEGFIWLVSGGLLYTIGAVIYAIKPKHFRFGNFGFHEIFHLFIMAGSGAHYLLVARFIIA